MRFPLLLACFVPWLAGCHAAGHRPEFCLTASPPGREPAVAVFVANGSGDFRTVSANLGRVVAEGQAPLQVVTVLWSHGLGRYVTDHVDHANHVARGARLAEEVAAYRVAHPGRKVCLVGHSAGCAVVLAAAERLPPGGVDRVVLLAPSVCVSYDLRPALRASRRGIDAFHSAEDRVILGLGMRIVGTADRRCRTAAGQCGFTPVLYGPADAALYGKLRQHPWGPAAARSGHDGGHYGWHRVGFLRSHVLPLLLAD
jgi:pimeloyl-ACP methyl ester carboxylesterase